MQENTPEHSETVAEKPRKRKSWRHRHARTLATVLFSLFFVISLSFTVNSPLQELFTGAAKLPAYSAAINKAIVICVIVGICFIISVIAANGIVYLFLPCKLKRAVPYHRFMEWVGSSNERKIVNLVRLHELHVYAAKPKLLTETENLPCRMVPLYMLPIYDTVIRWALRPFNEIYFDADELEELFDENLDVLRRARPDKLMAEGTLARGADAKLKITLGKAESNRGMQGRLDAMRRLNDYYKLHTYVLTKLVQLSEEKWDKRKNDDKVVTHKRIEYMVGDILAKNPALQARLLELRVKGSPNLPTAMEEFFRHAMPDEMVDWRNGKPSLEALIEKHTKKSESEPDDDAREKILTETPLSLLLAHDASSLAHTGSEPPKVV